MPELKVGGRKTYIMIDIANFTPELVGQDAHASLRLTMLPFCWYISEPRNPEWALVVTVSHKEPGGVFNHFHVALAQVGASVMSMAHGGGPSRECAIELSNHLNDIISQFVRL